tara:strand:- start:212 stop:418 length:207 start_codon:yes stop_codon:yes gene_type:complete
MIENNYILLFKDTSDIIVRCNKNDLFDIILDLKKSNLKFIDFFEYKSEEYKMFKYGEDYIAEDKSIFI